ncbi:hypothetical protein RRF57_000836 [Xylaria bambusicola]|uniref:Uncharacterized protein n=1 Tax=Xylaria bambusicola TaxID=326684 RepID=A0AAN7U4K5_9PEZI
MEQRCTWNGSCISINGKRCQKHAEKDRAWARENRKAQEVLLSLVSDKAERKTSGAGIRRAAENTRKRRERYKAAGLCAKCGKSPPMANIFECCQCRKKSAQQQKRCRQRRDEKLKEAAKMVLESQPDLIDELRKGKTNAASGDKQQQKNESKKKAQK